MNYCFTITWTNLTNNAELNKPDIKEYTVHDFIYISSKTGTIVLEIRIVVTLGLQEMIGKEREVSGVLVIFYF